MVVVAAVKAVAAIEAAKVVSIEAAASNAFLTVEAAVVVKLWQNCGGSGMAVVLQAVAAVTAAREEVVVEMWRWIGRSRD